MVRMRTKKTSLTTGMGPVGRRVAMSFDVNGLKRPRRGRGLLADEVEEYCSR